MATQSVKMEGVEALSKRLEGLKYDVSKKGGRFALRKAAQVVRDQARINAARVDDPRTWNSIPKNIVERWNNRLNKQTGNLGFRVGVLGGARDYSAYGEIKGLDRSNPGGDTFYWRFVEFGTEHSPAKPFMQPAIEQASQKATDTFIVQFGNALDRALKKAPK